MEAADLDARFRHHPPRTPERVEAHEYARSLVRALADELNDTLPEGREKSLVITRLEEALFWANAAIARQPQ